MDLVEDSQLRMVRHEPGPMDPVEGPEAWILYRILRHGFCRESRHMDLAQEFSKGSWQMDFAEILH